MENLRMLSMVGSSNGGGGVVFELHHMKGDLQRVDALQHAAERVIDLKLRYLDMCRVVAYVDHHFGSILFFLYGLDLLTMFGSVSSIVQSTDKGIVVVRAYYYVSTVIFILYCTLFMWPLVMAYEEVGKFYSPTFPHSFLQILILFSSQLEFFSLIKFSGPGV